MAVYAKNRIGGANNVKLLIERFRYLAGKRRLLVDKLLRIDEYFYNFLYETFSPTGQRP